jgi:hypothetical protein
VVLYFGWGLSGIDPAACFGSRDGTQPVLINRFGLNLVSLSPGKCNIV